jgi:hypothetical protein
LKKVAAALELLDMPAEVGDVFVYRATATFGIFQLFSVFFGEAIADRQSRTVPAGEVEKLAYLGQGEAVLLELLYPFEVDGIALGIPAVCPILTPRGLEKTELFVVPDGAAGNAEERGQLSDSVYPALFIALHLQIAPFTSNPFNGIFAGLERLLPHTLYSWPDTSEK